MDLDTLRERVTELLHSRRGASLSAGEIATALSLRGARRKRLQHWLHRLVVDGSVVEIHGGRFSLGAEADLVAGELSVARSGAGFVHSEQGVEVRVPGDELGTALPGDRVLVRIHPQPGPGEQNAGKVIRILERARRDIVGTLRTTGTMFCVVPMDPSYSRDIYVANASRADVGKRVVVRFTGWANRHVSPEGEIVQIIGHPDDPSVDTVAVMRHYQLPESFPPGAMREAERASSAMDSPGIRLDLRDRLIITIDPARARDFDDGLSLERDSRGRRLLGIHIADVSHFVVQGGDLDLEAVARGNSTYLPGKVIPMLPEQLSNGVCSLNPDTDRLAFSVFLTLGEDGKVTARRFARTLIRSRRRLTYRQVLPLISTGGKDSGDREPVPRDVLQLLRELQRAATQIRELRMARGALNLNVSACEVALDAKGEVTSILAIPDDDSHRLVEECMVAANEAVAKELQTSGIALISRKHDTPSREKLDQLRDELAEMGYQVGDLSQRGRVGEFLRKIEGDPLGHYARVAVLRSMKRALYAADSGGHFGLAKRHYAHFTSPIRRYSDLVVHRLLAAHIASGKCRNVLSPEGGGRYAAPGGPAVVARADALREVAEQCSRTERNSEEAESALTEILKYRFLARRLKQGHADEFDAAIVKVMNFGLFVEVPGLQLQGLVHVSSISDRFVRFNRSRRTLSAGKTVYRSGREVRVAVARVDFDKRQVDFVLA